MLVKFRFTFLQFTGKTVTMIVDVNVTVSSDFIFDSFQFSSLDIREIYLGGSPTVLSLGGYNLKG